jgi:ATP-binding protein involved in chromosome partitioning
MTLKMFQPNKSVSLSTIKYVIAVAAGKGGVGKSTVTVNLALALHNLGYVVGVMDTDIYGPSIRKMLPEDILPGQKGEIIVPALCRGIKMISMAYFRKEHEAAAVRAPIANGIVTQFIKKVEWGELDFLLIDFPPGTGDIQLTLAQQANLSGAILVTTPQEVALLDVRKAANLFNQLKIPIVGIVENMSYFQKEPDDEKLYLFGRDGGKRLADEFEVPFLGNIPVDPAISYCGDTGTSLFSEKIRSSESVQAFTTLAKTLGNIVNKKSQHSTTLEPFELIWKEIP